MSEHRAPLSLWVLLGLGAVLLLSCGAGVAWLASSDQGRTFIDAARG